ncbi:hypothetical protein ROJ8625_03637 [Roseivivax jejudonensis]|uniref:PRC-barrel domain protein n=1 Tax=Roseivivax jejudonensis TaxID=1529041 RepID=A0A1X7A3S7_9RHOB|nr:hypothetical protein [Roseivivax jejudonensis]SLN69761.1 hypothetical protein ROJ8625_03637 [Roseivivax jejudonensis]
MMTRILTTTALTLGLAGAAAAQTVAPSDDADMSVTGQAADAGREIVDTGQAAVGAVGEAAEETYGAASNAAARLDAALTEDAVIRSSDGEIVGTVSRTDMDGDRVLVDLDGEMENQIARDGVETIALQTRSMMVSDNTLMLDMTRAQLAAAIETGPTTTVAN